MEVGLNCGSMGNLVCVMGDGMYVGEYFDGIKCMNIIFCLVFWFIFEDLNSMLVMMLLGEVV